MLKHSEARRKSPATACGKPRLWAIIRVRWWSPACRARASASCQRARASALAGMGGLRGARGGQEVRQRPHERAAPRKGAPVALVERPRLLGAPLGAELPAQEVQEQRVVDEVGAAALQRGDERERADQP